MSRLVGLDRGAVEAILDEVDFAGVVHVVGEDDEAPLTIARGLADRASGIANTPATRFACASVSKLVTALTVARLVDAGTLAWDARYADLVGAAWRPAALDPSVTLRHLLGHTSGFGDYFDDGGDESYEAIWTQIPPNTIRGPKDFWPLLRDLPQVARPGERAVYNNGAFVLVGIALEEVTGLGFPELVRREVFGPLGMDRSGFWALDEVVPELAIGYLPPDPEAPPNTAAASWRTNIYGVGAMGGPDGGVQATAADLVRLLDGLTGRGEQASFLSPATRAELIGPHVTSDDNDGDFRYGLGVLHVGEGPSTRFGHTGEDPGASARAWTYPATGERLVVVSNVTDGAGLVTRRIDALLAGSLTWRRRGCSGCAGSTCSSPTGRWTRTRCAPSSRRPWSSTRSRAAAWLGVVPFTMANVGAARRRRAARRPRLGAGPRLIRAAPRPTAQARRGRVWRRGRRVVSSLPMSMGRAPSSFSAWKTSSRSSWHIRTMTFGPSGRDAPSLRASSPRRAAVSDS